jgi:hypothetical protein
MEWFYAVLAVALILALGGGGSNGSRLTGDPTTLPDRPSRKVPPIKPLDPALTTTTKR